MKSHTIPLIVCLFAGIGFSGEAFAVPAMASVDSAYAVSSLITNAIPATEGGNGDSSAGVLSEDGRFLAYVSQANNLANNIHSELIPNIFLYDILAGSNKLASLNEDKTDGGNGPSYSPTLSRDGQFVAFESLANNLVKGDTNGVQDIYACNAASGVVTLVSVNTNGSAGNKMSFAPAVSSDGRFVLFQSAASDLVPGDTNNSVDFFIRDMVLSKTDIVNRRQNGEIGSDPVGMTFVPQTHVVMSDDGRFVVFESQDTNMTPHWGRRVGNVYWRDLQLQTTRLASVGVDGLALGNARSFAPTLSGDGRFLAFLSRADNLVADGTNNTAIYLLNRETAALVRMAVCVPDDTNYPYAKFNFSQPCLSRNGEFLAFETLITDTNATNGFRCEVVWIDAKSNSSIVASMPNAISGYPGSARLLFLSSDGRCVSYRREVSPGEYSVFVRDAMGGQTYPVPATDIGAMSQDGKTVTCALNIDPAAGNPYRKLDSFLLQFELNQLSLVSHKLPELGQGPGAEISYIGESSLSADGRWVAFCTSASLSSLDTNNFMDVYVHDTWNGTNELISVDFDGRSAGINSSTYPTISDDGNWVAFFSAATNLTRDSAVKMDGPFRDQGMFVRDRAHGTNLLLGRYPFQKASFSPAQGRIAYKYQENKKDILVVRDLSANTNILNVLAKSGGSTIFPGNFSFDGRFFPYLISSNNGPFFVQVCDFLNGSITLASVNTNGTSSPVGFASPRVPPVISQDGRWVFFYSNSKNLDPSTSIQGSYLFARDLIGKKTVLISDGCYPFFPPSISADGRMVAYKAMVPRLFTYQAFVYDMAAGFSNLASVGMNGKDFGNGNSRWPSISADGRYVAFASDASNLVPNDTNDSGDIFVRDLVAGTTTLLSPSVDGMNSANRLSNHPLLSADGRTVVFQSFATDLAREHRQFNNNVYVVVFPEEVSNNPVLSLAQTGNAPPWPPALAWKAVYGTGYQLEFNDDLNTSNWIKLPGAITVLGGSALVPDPSTNMPPQRFYRLMALPLR